MSYFDQTRFDLRCEWGAAGVKLLAASDVIVIVDVLSFSTAVDVAVGRGATILPYRWKDESAAAYARERNAELAGARVRSDHKYSLAPSSLVDAPSGLRLVLPSPNGSSLAFEAASGGAIVVAGCLRNASAVAGWARQHGRKVSIIPAGERWPDGTLRVAIEDLLGAGAILRSLRGTTSPEAQSAIAAFEESIDDLPARLLQCASGRELVQRGFESDVQLAAQFDVSSTVSILKNGEFTRAGV